VDDADQAVEPGTELPGNQVSRPGSGLRGFTQKS
jgi:hypothetical protein